MEQKHTHTHTQSDRVLQVEYPPATTKGLFAQSLFIIIIIIIRV